MDLLIPHSGTLIWMLIAFTSIFFILKKFAWKPILGALKQREESIEQALKSADNARKEMGKLQEDNEIIIAEGKQESNKIIKEARELKDSIISDAKNLAASEAEKIIEKARNHIKSEKESAIKDIRDYVAQLSVLISEKVLQEKLSDDKEQKELIDKLLREVKIH